MHFDNSIPIAAKLPDTQLLAKWDEATDEQQRDEWSYPTVHSVSSVQGELAERVRTAFNISDSSMEVRIIESVESGGYSEYTQENEYNFTVHCGNHRKHFYSSYAGQGLVDLIAWLDQLAPKG